MEDEEEIIFDVCCVCDVIKPLTEFHKDVTKNLGRSRTCKKCKAIRDKKRFEQNREYERERNRKYRCNNKKQISKREKTFYLRHKKQILARYKKYRQTETGHFLIASRRQRRRARERVSIMDLTPVQWKFIVKKQKNRCNMCGKKFTKSRFVTVDHIIPLSKGGDLTSSNVQALCKSCNSSKNAKIMSCFINSWCI